MSDCKWRGYVGVSMWLCLSACVRFCTATVGWHLGRVYAQENFLLKCQLLALPTGSVIFWLHDKQVSQS